MNDQPTSVARPRKAVIPAAGLGTRFLPASKAIPKEMIPLVDRPTIQYIVEEASRAGLNDVLLITSHNKAALEDHFDRRPELEAALESKGKRELLAMVRQLSDIARVHAVRQHEPLGLGHAVLQAREHVGDESFAVLLADDLPDPDDKILERMLDLHEQTGRAVVMTTPVPQERIHLYGVVDAHATGDDDVFEVSDLIEKPARGQAPSNLAVVGRYVLPSETFNALMQTQPGRGGEIQLTDALCMMAQKEPILTVKYEGRRFDAGDKLSYLQSTVELAARRPDLAPDFLPWLRAFVETLDTGSAE